MQMQGARTGVRRDRGGWHGHDEIFHPIGIQYTIKKRRRGWAVEEESSSSFSRGEVMGFCVLRSNEIV
jgi:hypothetical protein